MTVGRRNGSAGDDFDRVVAFAGFVVASSWWWWIMMTMTDIKAKKNWRRVLKKRVLWVRFELADGAFFCGCERERESI